MNQENLSAQDLENSAGQSASQEGTALSATSGATKNMSLGLDFLKDVPLEVTVELGSSTMTLGDVLNVGPGALIDLNKPNGEPLDIKVNGVLIAKGEAVVINERFGVRLTSVMEPARVLKSISS